MQSSGTFTWSLKEDFKRWYALLKRSSKVSPMATNFTAGEAFNASYAAPVPLPPQPTRPIFSSLCDFPMEINGLLLNRVLPATTVELVLRNFLLPVFFMLLLFMCYHGYRVIIHPTFFPKNYLFLILSILYVI